jgi:cellulose synthase/poly-beta-1,6-N-acetylglucosamine synthase-like glycosyltransferase
MREVAAQPVGASADMTMTSGRGLLEQGPGTSGDDAAIRLSVIVACLDAEETLAEQLEALATQTCPVAWELLICDNGSTDGTSAIIDRFRSRLPLAVIDASARKGAGAARNEGAHRARGDWLAFCDADDVVAAGWLTAMATALDQHAFVAGRFEANRLNDRRTLRSRSLDQQEGLQHSPTGAGLPHAGAGNMGIHRELFLSVGGFDPQVMCLEDTDLSWRVQRTGVSLQYVPEAVVHVRLRASLRQMYRQGRQYGNAHAFLERRYRPATAQPQDSGHGPKVLASTGGRGVGAVARAWLGRRPSAGRIVWQLGWHRGYRAGSASPAPAPAQTAGVDA